ncbi:MAG: fumarylacetoacetate hydrolase family protein [Bdellovibrionales bacterium]|nr:fumarylacetoacetate hydrolase family protein [Bdellovibrionales bacterium]
MKLGSLKADGQWDGVLVVVSKDNSRYIQVPEISKSFREAIENWAHVKDRLTKVYQDLSDGKMDGEPMDESKFHSPLPRTFQWADGSAFLHHVKLVRMSRNAEMPDRLYEVPLMYQGGGDNFLGPKDNIPQIDFSHGTDFEGEVGVITDFVPMGTSAEDAIHKILFLVLINDVSLRGLIPEELQAGFGFFHGKPSSAFAPFAVTPDEIGGAWNHGRIELPLEVEFNGEFFGKANGKEMHFHFGQLIAHAAATRNLMPGTIIGSGTVSNDDPNAGSSCLLEKRMIEKINEGAFKTPFMKVGDEVKICMHDKEGHDVFGTIQQKVVQA